MVVNGTVGKSSRIERFAVANIVKTDVSSLCLWSGKMNNCWLCWCYLYTDIKVCAISRCMGEKYRFFCLLH